VDYVQWTGSAPPPPPPPPPSPLAEALDSDLSYTTGGEGNFVKWSDPFYFDGDAAESIAVSHGEQAWLKTTVDANSGDKISFYWKVSSEVDDYLEFYIDGGTYEDRISGEVDWQPKTYTLSSGSHTLEWRFIRDGGGDGGKDCGWVDFVQWTQPSPVQDPDHWNTVKYKYDPSGRRVEKNVDGYKTRYIYDGGNVIAEYDGNGNLTRKYIHGAGVDELVCMIDVADSSAVYYYHYDGLGSVVALSDSSGDSCQSYCTAEADEFK
jgi:YD repeat-containing protein